jgi:hypothetical protein
MYDASLPWQISVILSGLVTSGTLLLAIEALEHLTKEENRKAILRASLAIGFIFVAFAVPIWYRTYMLLGYNGLVALVGFSTIPFVGIALAPKNRKKGFIIACYCLAGIYLAVSIGTVVMAVLQK